MDGMKKYLSSLLLISSFSFAGESDPPGTSFPYITHWTYFAEQITIGFQTVPGARYEVQSTVDFQTWETVTNFIASGFSASFSASSDDYRYEKKRFFRFIQNSKLVIDYYNIGYDEFQNRYIDFGFNSEPHKTYQIEVSDDPNTNWIVYGEVTADTEYTMARVMDVAAEITEIKFIQLRAK